LTEDLDAFDVISNETDVERLKPRWRFGVAAQTTQPIERVRHLARLIRRRFPLSEVRVAETVCVPTRLRQEAAEALAAACDVVVVVGGAGATTRASCARPAAATANASSWSKAHETCGRSGSRARGWQASRGHVHARRRHRRSRVGHQGHR